MYDEVHKFCRLTLEKLISRLLLPLERGGRNIQPRLVDGDIWDGNVFIDLKSNTFVVYDAICIYAHNESLWIIP